MLGFLPTRAYRPGTPGATTFLSPLSGTFNYGWDSFPEQVHFGNADQVIAGREAVLREAWAAHPDRFVSGEPKPKPLPEAVWINPPTPSLTTQEIAL